MEKKKHPDFKEEKKLWKRGYDFVVGLDEVGRGPLAGPVCAAAVCIRFSSPPQLRRGLRGGGVFLNQLLTAPTGHLSSSEERWKKEGIKDSKKLSALQRERWYEFLTKHPNIRWGIGLVSEKIIDKINIFEATKLAMKKAIEALDFEPEYLLLDGNFLLEDLNASQKAVIRGDEKIFSIAAASIIAKVTRDRLMQKYHRKFPLYGFDQHKGYGTKRHFEIIKKHGPCQIHRTSFKGCQAVKFWQGRD